MGLKIAKRIRNPLDFALWRVSMVEHYSMRELSDTQKQVGKQLAESRLIWFSREMFEIAYETSMTLGDTTNVNVMDYLPTTSGMICFEGGLHDAEGRVDGLLWRVDPDGLFYVDAFCSVDYMVNRTQDIQLRTQEEILQLMKTYKDGSVILGAIVNPVGRVVDGFLEQTKSFSPLLLSCLLLIKQDSISTVSSTSVKRPALSKKVKSFKDTVSVVTLGNIKHVSEESTTGSKLSVRFIVGGHFRNQVYRSTGEVKRIFIQPYIKGPIGAPLKQSRPVYKF